MNLRELSNHRAILLITAIGLMFRLAVVPFLHQDGYTGDEKEYVYLGYRLSTGSGFVDSNGDHSSRSPLFPFFLGALFTATGPELRLSHLLGCLLGSVVILLVYLLGLRLSGSKRIALIAGCAAAVYPGLVMYSALLQTESLYMVFFLGSLLAGYSLAWKPSLAQGVLVGILAGVAGLTRGVYLAFFPLLLLSIWWIGRVHGRKMVYAILACVVAFIGLHLPWAVRNHALHGVLVPVSLFGGTSMLLGNNPYATGTWSTMPGFEKWLDGELRKQGIEEWASLPEKERNVRGRALALQFIAANPGPAAELALKKAYMFWIFPITNSDSNTPLQLIAVVSDILMLFGVALGLAVVPEIRTQNLLPLVAAILSLMLVHIVLHAEARYRLPLMPLLCIPFAQGLHSIAGPGAIRRAFSSPRSRILFASFSVVILAVYGYTGILFLQGEV